MDPYPGITQKGERTPRPPPRMSGRDVRSPLASLCATRCSRSLASPPRDPSLDLFIRDEISAPRGIETGVDLLLHVDVVLDVFIRSIRRELVKKLLHTFFRFRFFPPTSFHSFY